MCSRMSLRADWAQLHAFPRIVHSTSPPLPPPNKLSAVASLIKNGGGGGVNNTWYRPEWYFWVMLYPMTSRVCPDRWNTSRPSLPYIFLSNRKKKTVLNCFRTPCIIRKVLSCQSRVFTLFYTSITRVASDERLIFEESRQRKKEEE